MIFEYEPPTPVHSRETDAVVGRADLSPTLHQPSQVKNMPCVGRFSSTLRRTLVTHRGLSVGMDGMA